MEAEAPEKEKFPQEWKKKDALQRLCMMRCLRPDRMTYAVLGFVQEKLGPKFVENRSVEFAKSYEESGTQEKLNHCLKSNPLGLSSQFLEYRSINSDILHPFSWSQSSEGC